MVHFGNDDIGALVAMDAKTGRELWRSGKDGTAYSSPLLADFGGVHQIVQWNHEALVGGGSRDRKRVVAVSTAPFDS